MTAFTVREGSIDDLDFLTSLEAEVFATPWSREALQSHLTGNFSESLLLLSEGRPVGYLLSGGVPPESELFRIAVLPALRGQGGGRALLCHYLTALIQAGATEFFLEVRAGNEAAKALYRAFGYREISRRKDYYQNPKEDACIYHRHATTPLC